MARFKFIFSNGDVALRESDSIKSAAISACATRLNNKKPMQITSCFAEDPVKPKEFKLVTQPCVTIDLK